MPDSKGRPQDNEGRVYRPIAHPDSDLGRVVRDYYTAPTINACPACGSVNYHLIAEGADKGSPYVIFRCAGRKCGAFAGPFELHKPQMTEAQARRIGLYLPTQEPTIDVELDLPTEVFN
jgi:hypothetical protein